MVRFSEDILRAVPISESEFRREVAILLYQKGLPSGKAAELAGMDRTAFQHLLASHEIPVQYDVEDLKQDLTTLQSLRDFQATPDAS